MSDSVREFFKYYLPG